MLFYPRAAFLLPIILPQGLWVRRTVPKLPEPPGKRSGTRGSGPLLRLLVVGDSAAAGVGADSQDDALLGQLVSQLANDFTVEWEMHATSGHKTTDTLQELEKLPAGQFDAAVVSLGVNDAISMVSVRNWRERQAELRKVLHQKFGVTTLVSSGLPPLYEFPALPQPMRWHFGARTIQFDQALEKDIAASGDATYLYLRDIGEPSMISADGFHPGPGIYREWAERAAEIIRAG